MFKMDGRVEIRLLRLAKKTHVGDEERREDLKGGSRKSSTISSRPTAIGVCTPSYCAAAGRPGLAMERRRGNCDS
jgi:hypothetical protein